MQRVGPDKLRSLSRSRDKMSRRKLVAGNWKMHGSATSAATLVQAVLEGTKTFDRVDMALCPPYPYLLQV
ncbi:MAG: triose-phosphate isomerase, partial [Nevskiales bacterium]